MRVSLKVITFSKYTNDLRITVVCAATRHLNLVLFPRSFSHSLTSSALKWKCFPLRIVRQNTARSPEILSVYVNGGSLVHLKASKSTNYGGHSVTTGCRQCAIAARQTDSTKPQVGVSLFILTCRGIFDNTFLSITLTFALCGLWQVSVSSHVCISIEMIMQPWPVLHVAVFSLLISQEKQTRVTLSPWRGKKSNNQ